jgi:hypothetical protein
MNPLFLVLTACTAPDHLLVADGAYAPDDASSVTAEADEPTREAVSSGPLTLSVTVGPDDDGFVEIRPFAKDADEAITVGTALSTDAVTSDTISISVPATAPDRDLSADASAPVVYAISLRASDSDGEPGVYTGISDVSLVYYQSSPPSGASEGWNLAQRFGSDEQAWLTFSDGVSLGHTLLADDVLTLTGVSLVDVGPPTHLALAQTEDLGAVSVYDAPITPAWSATFDTPPSLDAIEENLDFDGAFLSLYSYDDDGADNARTDEDVTGRLCVVPEAMAVTWFADVYDLETALGMQLLGVRAGWDLIAKSEGGMHPASAAQRAALTLSASCQ